MIPAARHATSEAAADAGHFAAVDHLLCHCGGLAADERVVIVADPTTIELADLFAERAGAAGARVTVVSIATAAVHGTEPPADVAAAMAAGNLVLGLTAMSLAHTRARLQACAQGARYLSLPGYDWSLLADPALTADFQAHAGLVRGFAEAFSRGVALRVTSAAGTDVRLLAAGRRGNACPGFVARPAELGSPPDIEANVSPLEGASEGVIVVDGSIACPEVGLVDDPVRLRVRRGRLVDLDGADAAVVARVERLFADVGDPAAYVLAQCGVGLNDRARLTGNMLTDEGASGCVHFGFGSNATVGGANHVAFHLDVVVRDATLSVDGRTLLREGEVLA